MLGVIGGSGLYEVDGVKVLDEVELTTPWGDPSDKYIITQIEDKKVVFLPRHGKSHKFPPHLINFRANLWGFRKLGVDKILSISAVGGINPLLKAGDFVLSNQFLDFTKSRPSTFYEGVYSKVDEEDTNHDLVSEYLRDKRVVHIDVTEPFCPTLQESMKTSLEKLGFNYLSNATYAATEGPRLETAAEIKSLSLLGADIVGMTLVPEIVLARELAMHFVSLSVITNLAAGISRDRLTSDEVIEMMHQRNKDIKSVIVEFVKNLPSTYNCDCKEVLKGAAI